MCRGAAGLVGVALLCALPCLAQTAAVAVVDPAGLGDSSVRRIQRAANEALKNVAAWPVAGPEWKKGAPRKKCETSDAPCLRDVARATGAAVVVLLWLTPHGDGVSADAMLWLDGERASGVKSAEIALDSMDVGLRPLLENVLPGWGKKGWGGLRWPDEDGVTVKVDGRVIARPKGDLVAVPAGSHQLDILSTDGTAVLQRIEIPEGSRTRVDAPAAPLAPVGVTAAGNEKLRATSYGLFVGGAAAVAAGFIVGFAGRQTAAGANSCRPDSRECLTFEQAADRQRAAQGYARTGNVLLGIGFATMVVGLGLFVFDALFR